MRKLLAFVALAALVAGCNTIVGIGKDIEAAGEGIQRSTGKK
jgi:predicted small secreted protein